MSVKITSKIVLFEYLLVGEIKKGRGGHVARMTEIINYCIVPVENLKKKYNLVDLCVGRHNNP
jgi:hypothetical protein